MFAFGIVTSQRGIYLQHTNGNHYDVVESVCPRIQKSSSYQKLPRSQNITEMETPVTRKRKPTTKRKVTKQVNDFQTNVLNDELLEDDMEPAVKMGRHPGESEDVKTTMETTKRKRRKKRNANVTRQKNRDRMRAQREKKKNEQRQLETDVLSHDQPFLFRKLKNAAAKKVKYQTDVNYRLEKKEKMKVRQKDKYSLDLTYRENVKKAMSTRMKARYQNNASFRERLKKMRRFCYRTNVLYRERLKKLRKARYQNNALFRERLKKLGKARYENSVLYRERLKKLRKIKYENNALFRERLKKLRKARYQNDASFRERLKKLRKARYQRNALLRKRLMEIKRANYQNNIIFRERYKEIMRKVAKIRYKTNSVYRQQVAMRNVKRKKQEKINMRNCDHVLKKFREIVSCGPEYEDSMEYMAQQFVYLHAQMKL
ncbi:uncharacterized protein [Diadema antillarum]|uniref:uncharacterized protein n=1 Tax=Diadema antillarum TaxID=105358 RepID=UPI003A89470C